MTTRSVPLEICHKTTVIVADDHPLMREALRNALEKDADFEVVGEAADGQEAVDLVSRLKPDVAVLDIGMPKMNGLEATRLIKAGHADTVVLILTVQNDEQHVIEILKAGAAGYLVKTVFGEQVVQAIRAVVNGEMVLSPLIGREILKHVSICPEKPVRFGEGEKLSSRELQVLRLAARGMGNKEIAQKLGLGIRTVKGHLADIFLKFGARSRTEAVIIGLRSGMITQDDLG